jgi:hypothetical protein
LLGFQITPSRIHIYIYIHIHIHLHYIHIYIHIYIHLRVFSLLFSSFLFNLRGFLEAAEWIADELISSGVLAALFSGQLVWVGAGKDRRRIRINTCTTTPQAPPSPTTPKEAQAQEQAQAQAQPPQQPYGLVITGHSLGAGLAVLVALMLRPRYAKIAKTRCFAYGTPNSICDPQTAAEMTEYTICVAHAYDWVTRISVQTVSQLRSQVRN